MALIDERNIRKATLRRVAEQMLTAARTAPKGRGEDYLALAIAEEDDIRAISLKMKEIGARWDSPIFLRDSDSILLAPVLLLLGTRLKALGLKKCGMCGFETCEVKNEHPDIPCVLNVGDLGIAMGSAVSIAADHRVDCRIMYTVGQAVLEMGLLGNEVKIAYGIPLSATSKNPFFDRP
ncbi:MAG TPA: DUF2148 domain-containing protein [Candidatus Omnitrophota bacterium]|nr:DUF2148 domain-containing protein [Candidatus Omnitrophota bacterium]